VIARWEGAAKHQVPEGGIAAERMQQDHVHGEFLGSELCEHLVGCH
jgi:hypothetical protein